MTGIHFDLTAIVALWLGAVLLLVPLLAAAVRLAVIPLLHALARLREAGDQQRSTARLETLERELDRLADAVARLTDELARRAA